MPSQYSLFLVLILEQRPGMPPVGRLSVCADTPFVCLFVVYFSWREAFLLFFFFTRLSNLTDQL